MEFDIRIGTLLDTSQAEAQLQEFINKYSGDNDFKINLKITGDEKLEGIEKSLNNIKSLAKSIGNIKMDFDGGGLSVDTAFNKTIEKVKNDIKSISQDIGKEMGSGVEESVKGIAESLDDEINDIQKKIKSMIKNLEDLKLNPFADTKEIDKMMNSLKEMGEVSFDNFPNLTLQVIKEEMEGITKAYNDLHATAKNKQLDDIFQTTKVEPLRQQILALKEVLDFKNMDTSSLDKLLQDLKKTGEYSNDLKKVKSIFSDVKNSFSNISKSMGEKGITSVETAIKRLLEYKEKLQDQIRMEIDTSKIQKAESDIKRIDDAIERLRVNSDESIVKNLFDMSELKNMENMEKASKTLKANMEKLEGVFDKLKTKANQLSQAEFIDIASMTAVESYIRDIEKSIKSLDFDNLKATEINQVKEDLEGLEACIKSVKDASERMELEINFSNDLDKAEKQLNGLHSALIKLGGDVSEIEGLEKELESIEGLAKINLGKATNELKSFTDYLSRLGKEGNLGNISGDMSQFTKYVNDIVSSMKKLATTKDMNFAEVIKEEVRQSRTALEQLKETFDDTERQFADNTWDNALKGLSERFRQEVNKIEADFGKLKTSLTRLDMDIDFSGMSDELTGELNKAVQYVEKLENALDSLDVSKINVNQIVELRQELEQAKDSVAELSQRKIDLDCERAISQAKELKNALESLGESASELDGIASEIRGIGEAFENGTISYERATKAIKQYADAIDSIGDSSFKKFDVFNEIGGKLESTFSSISDAFSRFTLGELLEEAVESLASGVLETITGLDQAMTELRRVSDGLSLDFSGEGYKQIANDAREVAISVGQSVEDVITGMSTALQAGATTMAQATEIARTSALLQNVSDMGADEASQAIASLVNQYYSMDTALKKVQGGVKNAPADYNNLTNAIDMVNYAG